MRVLQVGKYYPPDRGGMETHLADLCQQMKDRLELEVIVSNRINILQADTVDGVEVTRLKTPFHILANPINPGLAERIRKSQADIVHLHWPNPMGLLSYMASGSKAKLVITYHSDIVRQKVSGMLFQPILEKAMRKATVIVTSPNYLESSPTLRKFRDRCRVVPLGINTKNMNEVDTDRVRLFKQRFGTKFILATGRHVPYKGFRYLVEAMQQVDGHLVLAGDGPLRPELESLSDSLGVRHKMSFVGQVSDEDLQALYAACGVFAFPSVARSEAFGLVQLEAMAAGKPVVNTNIDSGVPFVSVHEQTGLTVPPENVAALGKALNRLLCDERLSARYGDAARRRVLELFTLDKMGEAIFRVYSEVLGRPQYAFATSERL